MKIIKKIMQTRFLYVLVFLVVVCGIWFLYGQSKQENAALNQDLVRTHRVRKKSVEVDQDKIFKYRTQLSAMSDQHMMYLLHHPKIKKHVQYLKMTKSMMKLNDVDNRRIANLQHDINLNRDRLSWERPHKVSTNATRPQNFKSYNSLARTCVAMIIMVILDLFFLVKIFRFKDDQINKTQATEKIKAYQMMQNDQKQASQKK